MTAISMKDLFLQEFDNEAVTTRKILERVPFEKFDWTPHAKSTPLGRIANHIATLGGRFVPAILETDTFTFGRTQPLDVHSTADIVKVFDEMTAKARESLAKTNDEKLGEHWECYFGEMQVYAGTRAMAYRQFFMDHLIHHRAQLGVYLRLNDIAIPGSYGPSADEPM